MYWPYEQCIGPRNSVLALGTVVWPYEQWFGPMNSVLAYEQCIGQCTGTVTPYPGTLPRYPTTRHHLPYPVPLTTSAHVRAPTTAMLTVVHQASFRLNTRRGTRVLRHGIETRHCDQEKTVLRHAVFCYRTALRMITIRCFPLRDTSIRCFPLRHV